MKGGYLTRLFFVTLSIMSDIPTTEPKTITAGDTVKWKKTLDDYTASAFALAYKIIPIAGGAAYSVTAAADGDDHAVTIGAATSAEYTAGEYRWASQVTDIATGEERYTVDTGTLTILPDPAADTVSDLRSHARRTLDAIEATLEGSATKEQSEYQIDGRAIKYRTPAELFELRSKYLLEVRNEEAAEAIAKGLGTGNRIMTRFI